MASIDSSAPETTSSDNSPTLIRRTWSKHQGPGSDCGSSADSDSLGSSSSGEKDLRAKMRDNDRYSIISDPYKKKIFGDIKSMPFLMFDSQKSDYFVL